jgi:hypothetical protein
MRRTVSVIAALFMFQTVSFAQYGTALPGYYPPSYNGNTFTGRVVAASDSTGQITLAYKDRRSGKTVNFIGVLEKGYEVKLKDGSIHDMKPSLVPIGTSFTVYYMVHHEKVKGRKLTINVIFAIMGVHNLQRSYLVFKTF